MNLDEALAAYQRNVLFSLTSKMAALTASPTAFISASSGESSLVQPNSIDISASVCH